MKHSRYLLLLLLLVVSVVFRNDAVVKATTPLATHEIAVAANKNNILPLRELDRIAVVTAGMGGEKGAFATRCSQYADLDVFALNKGNISKLANDIASSGAKVLIIGIDDASLANAACKLASRFGNVIVAITADAKSVSRFSKLLTLPSVKAVVLGVEVTEEQQDLAAQTIFGGRAASGSLPFDIFSPNGKLAYKSNTKISFNATRLGYGLPEEVGFDASLPARIDSVCNLGLEKKAYSGCQVLVARHGKIVYDKSFGEINFGSGIPVTGSTLFGLASVSKATGTLSVVMKLLDEGKINLDEPASNFIEELRTPDKKDITFRQLLFHETGMPPSLNMWKLMLDPGTYSGTLITAEPTDNNTIKISNGAYDHKDARLRTDILSDRPTTDFNIAIADGIYGGKATRDTVMSNIYAVKLRDSKKYLYSCLNFCLLAEAAQRIENKPLDKILYDEFTKPLGANRITYRPRERFSPDEIAYTEVDTYLRRQHIHGYVHDELAAFSLGVQGNAGLFANADDLAKLFQMWLNGGTYGGHRFLSESTVSTFLNTKSPNSHRGLGFDKPWTTDLKNSSCCDEAPAEVVGHTGFTGTCFWVDPKNNMIYIFLSNRVCPTRSNPNFTEVSPRSHIQSILYQSI